jgi:hypothetical protein
VTLAPMTDNQVWDVFIQFGTNSNTPSFTMVNFP